MLLCMISYERLLNTEAILFLKNMFYFSFILKKPIVLIFFLVSKVFYMTVLRNTEFMVSVPARMTYDLLSDDYLQRSDVTRLYFNMTPWFNQSGDTMSCVWGRQHNG